jgi:hypothetical protein
MRAAFATVSAIDLLVSGIEMEASCPPPSATMRKMCSYRPSKMNFVAPVGCGSCREKRLEGLEGLEGPGSVELFGETWR